MKTFEIILTKSCMVRIKVENEDKAKKFSELLTNDIQGISSKDDRKEYESKIEDIDCKFN